VRFCAKYIADFLIGLSLGELGWRVLVQICLSLALIKGFFVEWGGVFAVGAVREEVTR